MSSPTPPPPPHDRRVTQLLGHLQPVDCASSSSNATAASSSSSSSSLPVYDVAVVGLGAMGISTLYHLSKSGLNCIGFERYTVSHANGSSHGETRITRLAYWEHPSYVPLLRRSFQLFDEMERCEEAQNQKLFHQTGSIDIGPEDESTFAGSVMSCTMNGLEHEILTPAELSLRFPGWTVPSHYRACFQPAGGMLFPERVTATTARLARKHGARIEENCEVIDVKAFKPEQGGGVEVITRSGQIYRAKRVVLSPGAWLGTLLQKSTLGKSSKRLTAIASMLKPERQVVTWYAPKPGTEHIFQPNKFPVWIATFERAHYYGFPLMSDLSPGLKIGRYHHKYEQLDSESILNNLDKRQATSKTDSVLTDDFMREMFGGRVEVDSAATAASSSSNTAVLKMSTCIFTNTPDEHFIVDPHPDPAYPHVSLISACSGHGFKFSSVLGEIMAGFITEGPDAIEKRLPVKWLDAGRLLGDRPPMQMLDPHLAIKEKKL